MISISKGHEEILQSYLIVIDCKSPGEVAGSRRNAFKKFLLCSPMLISQEKKLRVQGVISSKDPCRGGRPR